MDYEEAKKKVTAEKPKENLMVIRFQFDWAQKLVLPYKEGAALMAALSAAEVLLDRYDEQNGIFPLERDQVTTTVMSRDEYLRFKMAHLLGVKPEDLRQQEKDKAHAA